MTAENTDKVSLPPQKRWYVAELLVLHTIAGSGSHLLHNNFVLIQARTRETALDEAVVRGRHYDDSFVNTDGHEVIVRFIGLRNLHEIYDELENGAEILYEEFTVSSADAALEYVQTKEALSVFRTES